MLLNEKQKMLLEFDAKKNSIERVSVWLFDENRSSMTCNVIYCLSKNEFLPGLTITQKDFPRYFRSLDDNTIIDANDAINDFRTIEFGEVYLKPLGITSMLDIPIRDGEHVLGVVCHEHVGEKRIWTNEEKLFAVSIANQIVMAMETEEKARIVNALLESEQRFGLALTALPVIFWTTDKKLVVTGCRGLGLERTNLKPEDIIGHDLLEVLGVNENDSSYQFHQDTLSGKSGNYEYEFHGFVFQIFLEPLKDNVNNIIGCIGMAISISDRKEAEESLKEREKQLSLIFDTVADSIFVIDVEKDGCYRFRSTNKAFQVNLGISNKDVVGKCVNDIVPQPSLDLVLNRYQTAIKEKRTVSWEETTDYPTGKLTGIVTVSPLFDDFGNCTELIGSVKDITSRKQIENELKESEARFRLLAETTDIIPWESDAKTFQFTYVGPQAERILGYPVIDWYKYDFWPDHIHPDDKEEALRTCYQAFKTQKNYEFDYRMVSANGTEVWFHDVVTVESIDGVPIKLRGFLIDITERKQIENELKENEERFRLLAETTNIIPLVFDAKTLRFTYVGPQAERILGYPVEEWYTENFWLKHVHPDDKEEASTYFEQSLKTKKNYEFEYRMIASDGAIVSFHDIETVQYENNEPSVLRGYLIDVTTRKITEENIKKLNSELEQRVMERTNQLQQVNKELEKAKIVAEESKASKELFLASMSHEIRTPLNAIIGFQQLLKGTPLNEEQKEYVESIDFAGKNLLVIINDILDLSKIEAGKFQFEETKFNVSDITKSVLELVDHRAKEKNIKLFVYVDSTIPSVLYGDSARLSQILLNLIGNAIKFTEKGEIKISVNVLEDTKKDMLCEFIVEDTGIGIAEENLSLIFERFSQESAETSRKFGGTGLGLTISKHLVEMQGGKIEAKSEKGKGSIFKFQLRFKKTSLHATQDSYIHEDAATTNIDFRKLKILLAEDVLLNQRLVVKIMEKWGYDLDVVENGQLAVEKVKNTDYDLILMDIQMPVMDGYGATALIRSMPEMNKQSIPIIALTAHASQAEAEKCINLGMNAYVTKPFNQQSLQQIINQLTNK